MKLRAAPQTFDLSTLSQSYDELLVRAMSMREHPDRLTAWVEDYSRFAEQCARQGVSVEDL